LLKPSPKLAGVFYVLDTFHQTDPLISYANLIPSQEGSAFLEILNALFEFEDDYLKSNKSDFVFGIYQKK
jgi:hypothetical protein